MRPASRNKEALPVKYRKNRRADIGAILTRIYKTEETGFWETYTQKHKKVKDHVFEEVSQLKAKLLLDFYRRKNAKQTTAKRGTPLTTTEKLCEFTRTPHAFYAYKNRPNFNLLANTTDMVLNKSVDDTTFVTPGSKKVLELPQIKTDTKVKPFELFKTTIEKSVKRKEAIPKKICKQGLIVFDIGMFKEPISGNKENIPRTKSVNKRRYRKISNKQGENKSVVLDNIIRKCIEEEGCVGKSLEETNKTLNATIGLADNYKEVSQKVDKLSYAAPEMLEYLYFLERDEAENIKKDVKEGLDKYKSPRLEKYLCGVFKKKNKNL